jgi:hypothetical protein
LVIIYLCLLGIIVLTADRLNEQNICKRLFVETCAFAYSSCNSCLYASSLLVIVDIFVDSINKSGDDAAADIIQTVLCLILVVQLFIANQCSLRDMVSELLSDAFNDEGTTQQEQTLCELVKKFSSIGGTYVKTFSTSYSVIHFLQRYLPEPGGMVIGCTLAPFNAVSQFAIIGKKYSSDLLYGAAFATVETVLLSILSYVILHAANLNSSITIAVACAAGSLVLEMCALTFNNKSICQNVACCVKSSLTADAEAVDVKGFNRIS